MSLLISHSLTPATQRHLSSRRVIRRAKAALSILRIRNMLGLTDEDLLYAVSVVLERTPTALDQTHQR